MPKKRNSFRDRLVTHAILIDSCVVFPALVTWLAPVTWMTIARHDGRVEMKASVCLFFVIPFRHEMVADVIKFDEQTISGARERWTSGTACDQKEYITTESQERSSCMGAIRRPGSPCRPRISVTFESKVREFLGDPSAASLSLFAASNWKASVVAGGCVSLLTVLYIVTLLAWLLPSSWRGAKDAGRRLGKA